MYSLVVETSGLRLTISERKRYRFREPDYRRVDFGSIGIVSDRGSSPTVREGVMECADLSALWSARLVAPFESGDQSPHSINALAYARATAPLTHSIKTSRAACGTL